MAPAAMTAIVLKVFEKVFDVAKGTSEHCRKELTLVYDALASIGVKRLREIVFAVPVFVLFIRELIRRRDQLQAQNRLYVVGAGAALSTLLAVIAGGLITGLPFQIAFFLAHPALAIIIFTSGTTVVTAAVAVIVWLTIYVLTLVLADDPIFQEVYKRFVSADLHEMFQDVSTQVSQQGEQITQLQNLVGEQLLARGMAADPTKIDRQLFRWERLIKRKYRPPKPDSETITTVIKG